MGRHVHRLSEVDTEKRTAICANCGPIRVYSEGRRGGWRCSKGKLTPREIERRRKYMREYGPAYYARTGGAAQRRSWLKQYGITPEQYDEMVEEQEGRCAICGELPPEGERLHVGHCHRKGALRKLLCRSCNTALGLLRDSPELLRKAAEYLEAA